MCNVKLTFICLILLDPWILCTQHRLNENKTPFPSLLPSSFPALLPLHVGKPAVLIQLVYLVSYRHVILGNCLNLFFMFVLLSNSTVEKVKL